MTTSVELPDLSQDFALSPDDAVSYRRNGHVRLRAVASSDEIAIYGPRIEEAARTYSRETRTLEERDTYGKAFLQVMNLWRKDDAVRRFVYARRFAKVAADLMGVDGVRLYHDQALLKEPGGGPTPWHQDQPYWPLASDNTITMWMPLVDASATMGTMSFASGTHTMGFLGTWGISDKSEERLQKLVDERGFELSHTGDLGAGDATFHAGWILHKANPNQTDRMRSAMTVIYFADGTRLKEPDKGSEGDLRWMPGAEVGEVIDTELNPVLYKSA